MSKGAISASPSNSKILRAKGKSPGWTAFDLKQRGKLELEPEVDTDPYPPIQNTITAALLENSVISNDPLLRSFSSVVQPSTQFPVLMGNSNYSKGLGDTTVGDSVSKLGSEIGSTSNPFLEKLKELHFWADEGLIEDILGAVYNDFNQACELLKSMVSSGCFEETNIKNYREETSPFENFGTDEKSGLADECVPLEDGLGIAKLRSELDECDVPVETKLSDSTPNAQLNSRHKVASLVEPEWEEDDVYLCHRKDAIKAIRSASQHSRAARNAFTRGDRFSAKKLSLKAQEEWMAAENLNAKAAEEILNIRNKGNGMWKLDLHGLHASEAVSALKNHLWRIETQIRLNRLESPNNIVKPNAGISWQRPSVLQVVTGTGNHSRGPASLPTAVKSFLAENGYRYNEARPGVVDVWPKFCHRHTGENA